MEQNKDIWNDRWEKDFTFVHNLAEYRAKMGPLVQDYIDGLKALISKLQIHNRRVLDIGGGYGALLKFLLDDTNEKYLIDLSSTAVKVAREEYGLENSFALDFLHDRLPFNCKFDVILCNEVLEHIHPNDSFKFISRISENIQTGGILILSTPNLTSFTSIIHMIFGRMPMIFLLDSNHINPYTIRRLRKEVAIHGFEEIQTYTTQIRFHGFKFPVSLNLGEHLFSVWKKTI